MKFFPILKRIILTGLFSFIMVLSAFGERICVNVENAVARSAPSTSAEILWEKLGRYYPLFVLEKKDAWYHVRDYENDVAWIHKTVVGKTQTVVTKKNKCYVRSGPGREHGVVFVVDNGVPFRIVEKRDRWVKVAHADGSRGWIYDSLLW